MLRAWLSRCRLSAIKPQRLPAVHAHLGGAGFRRVLFHLAARLNHFGGQLNMAASVPGQGRYPS